MTTLSERERPGATRASAPAPTAVDLAQAIASFTATFERWARSLVAEGAPSYPRLKLLYALHCDGPQRMADLAATLEVTPRSVTALVDGLERESLVRRQPHPTDRRATMIELTDEARQAVERSMEHQVAIAALFETLSEGDRRSLLRLTSALDARMRATLDEGS
jgi:DNA-binding MarR family transcriptional regulator